MIGLSGTVNYTLNAAKKVALNSSLNVPSFSLYRDSKLRTRIGRRRARWLVILLRESACARKSDSWTRAPAESSYLETLCTNETLLGQSSGHSEFSRHFAANNAKAWAPRKVGILLSSSAHVLTMHDGRSRFPSFRTSGICLQTADRITLFSAFSAKNAWVQACKLGRRCWQVATRKK